MRPARLEGLKRGCQGQAPARVQVPFKSIERSFKLSVNGADASVQEEDKTRILNSIIGADDLLAEYPTTHPKYDTLNDTLRSRFAVAGLRAALLNSKLNDFLPYVTKGSLGDVSLDFGGVKQFGQGKTAEKLAGGLPATLKLTLLADDGIVSFLDALPPLPALTTLNLSNTGCGVEAAVALAKARVARPALRELNLSSCKLDDPALAKVAGALLKVNTPFALNLSTVYSGPFGGGPIGSIAGVPVYNDDNPFNKFGHPKRNGAAVKALGKLAGKGAMVELTLIGADLDTTDGAKLGEALLAPNEGCKLETLDLTNTGVGIKGATAIFEWLGASTSLTSLTMKAAGGFLKSAACLVALGKALQSNTTLTYLEISYNAELDVRWEGADAAHAQDLDDPTSGLALLCAGIAAHPTLRSLHMLGAGTIQATSGTQVRDNGPRLATAVLANPNIEIFGEVPIGALRSDAIKESSR